MSAPTLFPDYSAWTETGPVRPRNEDAFLLYPEKGLFAVADGLGGLPGGDEASRQVLEELAAAVSSHSSFQAETLRAVLVGINRDLCRRGMEQFLGGFGTTLTLALVQPAYILIGHVGDSSAWHQINDRGWKKLTTDHTVAERLRAQNFPGPMDPCDEHLLTQCMGQEEALQPEVIEISPRENDLLLLVTDGITGSVQPEDFHADLTRKKLQSAAGCLCRRAYQDGSTDNATAIYLHFRTRAAADRPPPHEGPSIRPAQGPGPPDK